MALEFRSNRYSDAIRALDMFPNYEDCARHIFSRYSHDRILLILSTMIRQCGVARENELHDFISYIMSNHDVMSTCASETYRYGLINIIHLLILFGIKIPDDILKSYEFCIHFQNPPIQFACIKGDFEWYMKLFPYGYHNIDDVIEDYDRFGDFDMNGRLRILEHLLTHTDTDADEPSEYDTPLELICQTKWHRTSVSYYYEFAIRAMRILFQHGANVNRYSQSNKCNPIHLLFGYNQMMYCVGGTMIEIPEYEIVKFLIEHGADPNATTYDGYTILILLTHMMLIYDYDYDDVDMVSADFQNYMSMYDYLVSCGADPRYETVHNESVLSNIIHMNTDVFTFEQQAEFLKKVLDADADVNPNGRHIVTCCDNPLCVQMLLEYGADPYPFYAKFGSELQYFEGSDAVKDIVLSWPVVRPLKILCRLALSQDDMIHVKRRYPALALPLDAKRIRRGGVRR